MHLVIPALHFPDHSGGPDLRALDRYIQRAQATWVDRFLLCGSVARGDELTSADRMAVLDAWLARVPASQLVQCCWDADELADCDARGVLGILVVRAADPATWIDTLALLRGHHYAYSHPRFAPRPFDAEIARHAVDAQIAPAGVKLSKVRLGELTHVRGVLRSDVVVWHGSSRHIRDSLAAGATGVVAQPLATMPVPFPARTVEAVQAAADAIQQRLDALPSTTQRRALLDSMTAAG